MDFVESLYLAEYYSQITEENKFLLRFYHDAYRRMGHHERMLDVGGGPTIYQLISASASVSEIVFSEFLEANRNEVKKWLAKHPQSFKWDEYFEFVARLEDENGNAANPVHIEARLRSRIIKVVHCDLNNQNPLAPAAYAPFDIVSSAFCIEGISNNAHAFGCYLFNAVSQLKEEGTLILAMVKECERYKVGEHYFPAFPVNERTMQELLNEVGFRSIEICTHPSNGSQGFSGVMGITAIKQR